MEALEAIIPISDFAVSVVWLPVGKHRWFTITIRVDNPVPVYLIYGLIRSLTTLKF